MRSGYEIRGNLGDVRVADVMPVNCNKQESCYGSTIKISLNPFGFWPASV